MKAIINKTLSGLVASSVVAGVIMADSYVGIEYGKAFNTTTTKLELSGSTEVDNDYSDVKLKFGTGEDGGMKIQTTLSFVSFEKSIFDTKNKEYIEIGFDLIKEFTMNRQLYPFIKTGLGVGSMDVKGYSTNIVYVGSFNLGAGISYKAIDHIYFIAGLDYVYRKWQDVAQKSDSFSWSHSSSSGYTRETSEAGFKPYIGINFQF